MRGALSTLVAGALASAGLDSAPAQAAEPAAAPAPATAETEGCSLNARQVVEAFIPLFYEQRNAKLAFERWVHPDYVQHNPGAPNGAEAAVAFLQPFFDANPDARYIVHRVIASDGLVAVHNEARFVPGAPANAVVDIFRVNNCRIVEHWDVIQPVPESSANGNTMFDTVEPPPLGGPSEPCTLSARQVVERFIPLFYEQGNVREAYDSWVHENYQQHNPGAQNGRASAIAFLEPIYRNNPNHRMTVYRVIAEDDLVAVHLHGQSGPEDPGAAAVDILRVDNCRIVEHWDVTQAVPKTAMNENGMF